MNTTSWLDHVICTADARCCVTDMTALYECVCSDHHPLLFSIDFGIVPAYGTAGNSGNKRVIHWDKLISTITGFTRLGCHKFKSLGKLSNG